MKLRRDKEFAIARTKNLTKSRDDSGLVLKFH